MKVTSREITLLVALLSVALIYLLYTFLFNPLLSNISVAKESLNMAETQQLQVEENRNNLPDIIKQQDALIIESEKKVEKFIPNISEDVLVTFFAGTTGKGGPGIDTLSFDPLTAVDLSTLVALPVSGLSYPMGDLAMKVRGNDNGLEETSSPVAETPPVAGGQPGSTVLSQGLTVNFENSAYEQVISQIKTVEALKRTVIIDSISLSKNEAGSLIGSIHYNFYGLDKLTEKDRGLEKTVLTDSNGKTNPFN